MSVHVSYIYDFMNTYIHIYIYRERERELHAYVNPLSFFIHSIQLCKLTAIRIY